MVLSVHLTVEANNSSKALIGFTDILCFYKEIKKHKSLFYSKCDENNDAVVGSASLYNAF